MVVVVTRCWGKHSRQNTRQRSRFTGLEGPLISPGLGGTHGGLTADTFHFPPSRCGHFQVDSGRLFDRFRTVNIGPFAPQRGRLTAKRTRRDTWSGPGITGSRR